MVELPSQYRTGDNTIDQEIAALVEHVAVGDRQLVFEMVVTALRLAREDTKQGDLKLVTNAMKEFRYSFAVFAPYQDIPKCTIFGSARIKSGDPAYQCAKEFAAAIAARGWMVITGAGPGIMEAGHEGAGAENSFGVNIILPFEAAANPIIADDPKLINYRYFFTRKVMFMKESHAYVLLPGGFGTMDESFELLTLIQTGKSPIAPIVLFDPPGSSYWKRWCRFVTKELLDENLISAADLDLLSVCQSVNDAVAEICGFYRTYHSMRFVGDQLVLRLHRRVGNNELARLNTEFTDIIATGTIERIDTTVPERRDDDVCHLDRIALHFDRHGWSRIRRLIDALNDHPDSPAVAATP